MRKTLLGLVVLSILLLTSVAGPTFAGSEPLPPMPPQWLIDKVINETNGPTFTPVYAPDSLWDALAPLNGALDFIEWNLDFYQAVNYIGLNEFLYEAVVPIYYSGVRSLQADITAPGSPSAPGQIIGATYQRGRGAMAIVATFPNRNSNTPNGLRFYYNSTQYYSATPVVSQFIDPNFDGMLAAMEEGAVISDRYSCIAIGLRQVCWTPYSTTQLRDADAVRSLLTTAESQARARYNFNATFGLNDAVPDMIGKNRREWCASDFGWKSLTEQMQGCQPNLVFVHANTFYPNQPIGLWVVRASAELKAYDMNGGYWGWVQPNSYLVMNVTPLNVYPGQVGVLMLVAINGSQHFLIPSVTMQGFGQSTIINEWEAAIKDGTMHFRGF